MLDDIPEAKAVGLVLRHVLLGQSQIVLDWLRSEDARTWRLYDAMVRNAIEDASAAPPRSPAWRPGGSSTGRGWRAGTIDHLHQVNTEVVAAIAGRSPVADEFVLMLDRRIADFTSKPFDPFEAVSATADAAATMLYGLEAGDLQPRVETALLCNSRHPSPFTYASGVCAKTSRTAVRRARVVVSVCPAAFERDCMLSLPYVLFHEYICHAARLALGGPPPDSFSSAFTEGWMDYVAAGVHDFVLDRDGPDRQCWIDPASQTECARRFQAARLAHYQRTGMVATGVSFGWNTAAALDRWLGNRNDRWRPLWTLSARLNGSQLRDTDLDEFVAAVHGILRRGQSGAEARLFGLLHDPAITPEGVVDATLRITAIQSPPDE